MATFAELFHFDILAFLHLVHGESDADGVSTLVEFDLAQRSVHQVVVQGFAAFHVGIETDEAPADEEAQPPIKLGQDNSTDYVDGMSE